MIKELDLKDFDEEIETSSIPILVDFYSESCGPCRKFETVLLEIKDSAKYKLKLFKVNINQQPVLVDKFKVMGLPTIVFFVEGKENFRLEGAYTKSQFIKKVEGKLNIQLK